MILVVDDEEPIRAFAKDTLEAHGYRVLLARDGSEAVELFRKYNGSIGLVILDMVMPNMGGRETFKKLKELNPDTRALLSTGCGQNGHAQEILESGGLGFIQKPYQINTLLSKVRKGKENSGREKAGMIPPVEPEIGAGQARIRDASSACMRGLLEQ
jgi:DNA-binding response OmpR family regulator